MSNHVPNAKQVQAARAGLDAASDILEKMPNVDPFVVKKLRELSQDLYRTRNTHPNMIITWPSEDLVQLYSQVSYQTKHGPATLLRQLEHIESIAPDHKPDPDDYLLMLSDDERVDWLDQIYEDDSTIMVEVLDAIEYRLEKYQYHTWSIPEIARQMYEEVLFYCKQMGAVEDYEQWKTVELPGLRLEHAHEMTDIPNIEDDLVKIIDERVASNGGDKFKELQKLRRETEAWLATMDAWWGRRDLIGRVQEVAKQFDEPIPPGWLFVRRDDGEFVDKHDEESGLA